MNVQHCKSLISLSLLDMTIPNIIFLFKLYVHVCEGLRYSSSRERLARDPESYEECVKFVTQKVTEENAKCLKSTLVAEVCKQSAVVSFS